MLVVALGLGLVSSARIFGTVWFYLLLWAWGLVALMLFAIGWTAVELGPRRSRAPGDQRVVDSRAGRCGRAGRDHAGGGDRVRVPGTDVTVQTPRLNNTLGALIGPTTAALDRIQTSGVHGPYLVTWLPDAEAIGSAGFGLLNELDRRGFDVRAGEAFRPGRDPLPRDRRPHADARSAPRDRARHRELAARLRFKQVAYSDPRTDAERAVRPAARSGRRRSAPAGMANLVPQVDDNLFMLALAPAVPVATRRDLADARPEHADGRVHRPARDCLMPDRDQQPDPRWFRPALAIVVAVRSRCGSRTC